MHVRSDNSRGPLLAEWKMWPGYMGMKNVLLPPLIKSKDWMPFPNLGKRKTFLSSLESSSNLIAFTGSSCNLGAENMDASFDKGVTLYLQ